MLGYKDPKFGDIKVLNVTEARSQFADVLADKTAVYVITKNNKPKRVIINFDDFEDMRTAGSRKNSQLPVPTETPIQAAKPEKRQPPQSQIKGLLSTQNKLAQPVTTKSEKPAAIQSEPPAQAVEKMDPSSIPETPLQNMDETMSGSALSDYFSQDSAFDIIPDDIRISPPIEQPVVQHTQMAAPKAAPARPAAPASQTSAPVASPTPKTPTRQAPAAPTQKQEPQQHDATPDDDYFNRFRKLYEPVPAQTASAKPIVPPPAKPVSAPAASAVIKAPAVEKTETPLDKKVLQEKSPTPAPAPKNTAGSMKKVGESGDMPSLQDLLKELESERLSDEEEAPLNEKQISDLIQRITNDY